MRDSEFDFSGKRVLVTGGTGFIGGRLVEKLVSCHDAKVRVLVRNYANAARIARMPIKMIHGDINNLEDVCNAVEGCDVVFHCAYGNSGSDNKRQEVNIEGTRNIAEAKSEIRCRSDCPLQYKRGLWRNFKRLY